MTIDSDRGRSATTGMQRSGLSIAVSGSQKRSHVASRQGDKQCVIRSDFQPVVRGSAQPGVVAADAEGP